MARFIRTVAAGKQTQIDTAGNAILMKETTGEVYIHPDNRGAGRFMDTLDKWTMRGPEDTRFFTNIVCGNQTGSSVTFTIEVDSDTDEFESSANAAQVPVTQASASDPWNTLADSYTTNTDGSKSVGLTTTSIVATSASNKLVTIQPQGGDIWIRKGAAAAADSTSLLILDGGVYECNTTLAINGIAVGGAVSTFWEALRA